MAPRLRWQRYPRDLEGAWHAIDDLREAIDDMQIADEVAEKVRAEIRKEHSLTLTTLQKLGGTAVGLIALADLIRGIVG